MNYVQMRDIPTDKVINWIFLVSLGPGGVRYSTVLITFYRIDVCSNIF